MSFEVPESKSIDIDALKKQIQAFFKIIIDTPSIMKKDQTTNNDGWEASPELLSKLDEARQDIRNGNGITLRSQDDINAFFESL